MQQDNDLPHVLGLADLGQAKLLQRTCYDWGQSSHFDALQLAQKLICGRDSFLDGLIPSFSGRSVLLC